MLPVQPSRHPVKHPRTFVSAGFYISNQSPLPNRYKSTTIQ